MQIDSDKIKKDIFKDTPHHLIADIIVTNYPNARVTDKLIESYIDLALSKEFTLDKTINEIRKLNSFDTIYEGKISFILNDSNEVIISEETFTKLQENINNNIVEFMRKNKENFMNVIDIIQEESND